MSMHTLEELSVPQPPYRMKRPEAVLAADAGEPVIASTEGEVLLPVPEVSPSSEAGPRSPTEVVAERSAVIESATQDARAKLDQPPLADASPQESSQDDANRQSALGQVESVATNTNTRVAALKEGLAKMASETRTPEQQGEDKALAQKLREERDQRPAKEAAAAEERRQQEEQARKADIESKKAITRSQTAAIKEDAVREEKKLEEGIEFKQPEESTATKASRIGRKALEDLNAFKDLQEKGAAPEQLEFARQQADLSQKRAEAAKRGENIPEERVDMAKVEAAGTFEGRDAALNARLKELMKATQDASEAGDKAGASAAAREFMKVRSDRIRLRTQRDDAAAEDSNVNQVLVEEKNQEQPATPAEAAPASPEEIIVEAEPRVGDIVPGKGRVVDYEPSGKAIYEALSPKEARAEEFFKRMNAVHQDAEEGKSGFETQSDDFNKYNRAEMELERMGYTREQINERMKADKDARANNAEGQPAAPAAEAAPTAPAEREPTAQERRITQLEQQIAQLQAQLSGRPAAGPPQGPPQPPQGPPQGPPQAPPAPPQGPPAPAQGPPQGPPAPQQGPPTRIGDIGEQQGLNLWERFKTKLEAGKEDVMGAVAAVLAKKWQGRLERRDEKIKEWEDRAKESSKKGALGMAKSIVWDEVWANYHRARGRHEYKKQEAWNDGRVRRENARDEVLNLGAARIDRLLDSQLERIDQYALQRDEQDRELEMLHEAHKFYTGIDLAKATPTQRQQARADVDAVEKEIKDHMEKRGTLDAQWQAERKRAAKQQSRKEELLNYAVRPSRIDTTPKDYKWLNQRIKRPLGSPKARTGSKRAGGLVP